MHKKAPHFTDLLRGLRVGRQTFGEKSGLSPFSRVRGSLGLFSRGRSIFHQAGFDAKLDKQQLLQPP